MDVRKSPEGYKLIVEGGDTNETRTELEKIKLQEKSIYLIAVLRNALKVYPNITNAVKRQAKSAVPSPLPIVKEPSEIGGKNSK